MSSDNESVIFPLCGCGIGGADLVRYGAIYRPASVNVITDPFCLASGIWPRRVQNDRLIIVWRRQWLGLVATSRRRRLIALSRSLITLRSRIALIARNRWRPVGIGVRAIITVVRVGWTVGAPPSDMAKPNANKRFMDALLWQPSNNFMTKFQDRMVPAHLWLKQTPCLGLGPTGARSALWAPRLLLLRRCGTRRASAPAPRPSACIGMRLAISTRSTPLLYRNIGRIQHPKSPQSSRGVHPDHPGHAPGQGGLAAVTSPLSLNGLPVSSRRLGGRDQAGSWPRVTPYRSDTIPPTSL